METNKSLKGLFEATEIKVPSYQRAYAWEEKQLEQFVADMLEVANKNEGQYYFGHFILEQTDLEQTEKKKFEIIDGQQRITTFVLFLIVCKLFSENQYSDYVGKFKTVDYDQPMFELVQAKRLDPAVKLNLDKKWLVDYFDFEGDNITLSIKRIIFALDYFRALFFDKKLDKNKIDRYIETFTTAHISTHITTEKAVAVQIFELQNTRGIKLSLIEMVKAMLMKAVYLHSKTEETESNINFVRNEFAEIYKLEELTNSSTFRGELLLEDILLHHLRIVDDGNKLTSDVDGNKFKSPSKSGGKEEVVLNYIKNQITEKQSNEIVSYVINLSKKFRLSVELVSVTLANYDKTNRIIGDVLILDKNVSIEFFILLFHLEQGALIQDKEFVKHWERFLFTRDFHEKYYNLRYKDNFEDLFFQTSKNEPKEILEQFISNGFRRDKMDDNNLSNTVRNFVKQRKDNILDNAFHQWFREKIFYVLYKYEISKLADLEKLRQIMKEGRSVEHILPQEWNWVWIDENTNNISEKGTAFYNEISGIIHGLGNLLLVTVSENSRVNNNHPKEKIYNSCTGGSYSEHNENSTKWEDYKEWKNIIASRGNKIYKFLEEFIS